MRLGSGWQLRLFFSLLSVWALTACEKKSWRLDVLNFQAAEEPFVASQLNSSGMQNKLLFINYWAEWCKPCIKEIPELNHFYKTHNNVVLVLGVNFDSLQGEVLTQAALKAGITFPVVETLSNSPFVQYSVKGLPTTLIFSAKGELLDKLVGPQTEASLQQALIKNQK